MQNQKILIHKKYVYSGLYYIENWRYFSKPQEKKKKKLILAIMVMRFIMVIKLQQTCQ